MSGSPARDLLIEIGTEELPAAAQLPLAAALAEALDAALEQRGLAPASLRPFAAPRRLAVLAQAVPSREPSREIERRGPNLRAAFHADGTPTAAAIGFARSVGVEIAELDRQGAADGERLVYRHREAGRPLDAVLLAILPELFAKLPLPQRMRWGSGEASFLRPVRWLTLRYGRTTIPWEAFGLRATGRSRGHRLHHPGPVAFAAPASYEEALQAAKVLVDPIRREAELRRRVIAALEVGDRVAAPPPGLYQEITGLVEWPVALTGRFDEHYLRLPDAVLVTTLAHHQRLIPVRDREGRLQPEFVAVVDIESSDPDTIRQGLERVVRSRLEDAAFYYRRDRERALGEYLADLEGLAFGRKLGDMAEKAARLARLAGIVAALIGADRAASERAGLLAKCDLVTGIVFEFPELQGVMGAHYARVGKEGASVATAIAEQYLPTGAADSLPASAAGIALAIADRVDNLVGGFASGLQPTGTRDPFGLRRSAFGLLRIVAERAPALDLGAVLDASLRLYPKELRDSATLPAAGEFLRERLDSLLQEAGHKADVIRAVLAVAPLAPGEVFARAAALSAFRCRPEASALAAAHKRIANILRHADQTGVAAGVVSGNDDDGATRRGDGPSRKILTHDTQASERQLREALEAAREGLRPALSRQDFGGSLEILAGLRPSVDQFFDEVLVMDPEPARRAQLLALLRQLHALFLEIADFGLLQEPNPV